MRAMLNLLCALAIFAGVSLFTACGPPPVGTDPDGGPICPAGSKSDCPVLPDGGTCPTGLQLVGGQCVKPDAGPPADPCAGFKVPLANRCEGDYRRSICTWELVAENGICYLFCYLRSRGELTSCVMLPEYSGAEQFSCHDSAGYLLSCTM